MAKPWKCAKCGAIRPPIKGRCTKCGFKPAPKRKAKKDVPKPETDKTDE